MDPPGRPEVPNFRDDTYGCIGTDSTEAADLLHIFLDEWILGDFGDLGVEQLDAVDLAIGLGQILFSSKR